MWTYSATASALVHPLVIEVTATDHPGDRTLATAILT